VPFIYEDIKAGDVMHVTRFNRASVNLFQLTGELK
jgi:hypothetical protein